MQSAFSRWFAVVAIAGVLLLTACAEEGAGPEFASDPRPTQPALPTALPATPAPLPTSFIPATPVSLDSILMSRGAPRGVYLVNDGAVWSLTTGGDATRVLVTPEGARVVAISPSPSRAEVAVLLESDDPSAPRSEVVFVGADSSIVQRVRSRSSLATPMAGDADEAVALDWSPQGDRILVGYRGGELFGLPVDGTAEAERLIAGGAGEVIDPTWSPTGDRIAYIATDGDRRRALMILDTTSGEEIEVVPPSGERAVVEFAWAPDGASLLFTESGTAVGAVSGVDLWQVAAAGGDRELVASAGTVAPVARIANVRPSPDGRSVAYEVLVPGQAGPRVDSVWVRDLTTRQGFRLDLPPLSDVRDIWWVEGGLLIWAETASADDRRDGGTVFLVDDSGAVEEFWRPPDARATPVGSTPEGTPVIP
jgi:dipeptidyl aminopeptidase/acylaminoacyl peptidase